MVTRYLLYVDILGFEKLADEIANISGLTIDYARQSLLSDPFTKAIANCRKDYYFLYQGTDNFVIIFKDSDSLFSTLERILNINIEHLKFGMIPIEVAIDIVELDELGLIEPKNCDSFINSLKTGIIEKYKNSFKEENGISVKNTFVLSTNRFYNSLDTYNREDWKQVPKHNFFIISKEKTDEIAKLIGFIKNAGLTTKYKRINKLYVFPSEFESMLKKLRTNKVLIISGTQETGKTYSAIRILWQYYLKGYFVKYFPRINKDLTSTVSDSLTNVTDHIKPHTIIYFEDPYGRVEYLPNDYLERNISTILSEIKNSADTFVIITSRSNVFKEFQLKKIGHIDFDQLKVNLNIKSSYDFENREKLLYEWAMASECKWIQDSDLVTHLKNLIKMKDRLPTPLNIHDFCIASSKIIDKVELEKIMVLKSKETSQSFADEIRAMKEDKILFVSFIFISDSFLMNFIKEKYNLLVRKMGIHYWRFEKVLEWFEVDQDKIVKEQTVKFFHPSYSEALGYLLADPTGNTRFKLIFNKVLKELALDYESRDLVYRTVAENFDFLGKEERNILLDHTNGVQLLLSQKILRGKEAEIGRHTQNAIGEEGYFLYEILISGNSEELPSLFSKVGNWNQIWKYVRFLEKKSDSNFSTPLLMNILELLNISHKEHDKIFSSFMAKLSSVHVDNVIKSLILDSNRSEMELIDLVNKQQLVKRVNDSIFNCITVKFIKKRIDSLFRRKFIKFVYPSRDKYRPGAKLVTTFYSPVRRTNEERVTSHIDQMIIQLKLNSDIANQSYQTHAKLKKFYLSTTHEPLRIAAAIVDLSHGFLSESIHRQFGVNPGTTRKIGREISQWLFENIQR